METIVQEMKFFLTVEQLLHVVLGSNGDVGGLYLNLAVDKDGKVWVTATAVERNNDQIRVLDKTEAAIPTPPGGHKTIDLTTDQVQKAFFDQVLPNNSTPFSNSYNSFT